MQMKSDSALYKITLVFFNMILCCVGNLFEVLVVGNFKLISLFSAVFAWVGCLVM